MAEIATDVSHEIDMVVRLRDENNMTFAQIAEVMDFSESTAKRRYQAGMLLDDSLDDSLDDPVEDAGSTDEALEDFPEVEPLDIHVDTPWIPHNKGPIERFEPLTVVGDAIVTCDFHIPLHDPILINTMINVARIHKIKKLIIGGDYYNMETFSSFLPYQPEAALDIERYDGTYIMKALLQTFDEIIFIWGNHDFRLTRKLGFKRSFEECMRWMLSDLTEKEMKKIKFSELDYMYYYPEPKTDIVLPFGRKFRICHPRNFSSVPLTVGRKLAQKYNCSIITAHSHHFAIGVAPNGVDLVLEGGGFFDKDRTEYIQRTTNHHEWVQGFTMFKDGLPTLISPAIGNDVEYRKEVIS